MEANCSESFVFGHTRFIPLRQSAVQLRKKSMDTDSGPDRLMVDKNAYVPVALPGHENLLSNWGPIITLDST